MLLEPSDGKRAGQQQPSSSSRANAPPQTSYSVPSIFCAGDSSQSVYGWRGGAPELTVHGFRRDYPQGIVAPLGTCYRLPNDIVEAAEMLLPAGGWGGPGRAEESWEAAGFADSVSYDVSPAAAERVTESIVDGASASTSASGTAAGTSIINRLQQFGSNVISGTHRSIKEEKVRLGNQLLLSKGMQKLDSTVVIHGLWDAREEAKYIAQTI